MEAGKLREIFQVMKEFEVSILSIKGLHVRMDPQGPQIAPEEHKRLEKLYEPVSDEELLYNPYFGLDDPEVVEKGVSGDE